MKEKTQARIVWTLFTVAVLLGLASITCGVLLLMEAL